MKAISYNYPPGGAYNEITAILSDGREVTVNTQYACADVLHKSNCDMNREGDIYVDPPRVCTCGNALSEADVAELVADARINGKPGKPVRAVDIDPIPADNHGPGWCDKCHSYCCGDCES